MCKVMLKLLIRYEMFIYVYLLRYNVYIEKQWDKVKFSHIQKLKISCLYYLNFHLLSIIVPVRESTSLIAKHCARIGSLLDSTILEYSFI